MAAWERHGLSSEGVEPRLDSKVDWSHARAGGQRWVELGVRVLRPGLLPGVPERVGQVGGGGPCAAGWHPHGSHQRGDAPERAGDFLFEFVPTLGWRGSNCHELVLLAQSRFDPIRRCHAFLPCRPRSVLSPAPISTRTKIRSIFVLPLL